MESINQLLAILPIIITIVGGIYTIYKRIDSDYQEYSKKYYKMVVEPFYYECIIKSKDVKEYFNENDLEKKYYEVLPTYILKLLKDNTAGSKEKLYKVMCVDFIDNRPCRANSVWKSLDVIIETATCIGTMWYIVIFGIVVMMVVVGITSIVSEVLAIIESLSVITTLKLFLSIALFILVIIIVFFMCKMMFNSVGNNEFSLNRKNVNAVINDKIKKYEKLKIDLFQ